MTWDKTFPTSGTFIKKSPKKFRENWEAIEETFDTDHRHPGASNAGEHKKVTFYEAIATPSNVANKGFLYAKDVNSKPELHFLDEEGNEIQLTDNGRKAPRTFFIYWNGTTAEVVPSGSATVVNSSTGIYDITLNEETANFLSFDFITVNSQQDTGGDDLRRVIGGIGGLSSGGGQTTIVLRFRKLSDAALINMNWKLIIEQAG